MLVAISYIASSDHGFFNLSNMILFFKKKFFTHSKFLISSQVFDTERLPKDLNKYPSGYLKNGFLSFSCQSNHPVYQLSLNTGDVVGSISIPFSHTSICTGYLKAAIFNTDMNVRSNWQLNQ